MPKEPDLVMGMYRHYKGGLYRVTGMACHTETLEWHVVYESLERKESGLPSVWIRPYAMFVETIVVNSEEIPRFARLDNE